MFEKGSTFWTRAHHLDKEHLSVLVAGPAGKAGQFLMVNFTTLRAKMRNPDRTYVAGAGDHPEIKQESFVIYQRAELIFEKDLERRQNSDLLRLADPVSPNMLNDILNGVRKSPHTKSFAIEFLDEHGF